ncbi:MAG: hypothetical protein IJV36_04915 [Prevotella sp.]|nr:hypothetical protein [Prevotella sp.]MBQ9672986.1 hypothetical protein [Prevotella sp.]
MKLFIFTVLLTTVAVVGFAQQVILADSITNNPVSYATVYDANGTVIGCCMMIGDRYSVF